MSYKNASACGDKASEAQRLNVPILTIWSPSEAGKCEVDPKGATFAKIAREKLVKDCLEEYKTDPQKCMNLTNAFNAKYRVPPKGRKNTRCKDRFAVHIPKDDADALRTELPLWGPLVPTFVFIFENVILCVVLALKRNEN